MVKPFDLSEITIAGLQKGYASGAWTARDVVAWYVDRVRRLDQAGPCINSVISLNPHIDEQAAELDAYYAAHGPKGPLHGVVLMIKDQIDVKEMPTTGGSVIFKDNWPNRDATIIAKLREAGALMLGKTTLGEMGAGDTHGSLFGSTRNVYAPERTAGGSSGGSGAAASANFCTVALGQEGFASIRRPSIWNGVVGMRPSIGLVSRGGVYDGWPSVWGSVGPMARTVEDAARVLDAMVGYDPMDPVTAHGVGQLKGRFIDQIRPDGLQGVRLGVLRASMGVDADPSADDFKRVAAVFETALTALRAAGAVLVDVEIPGLKDLIKQRAAHPTHGTDAFEYYTRDLENPPFRTKAEAMASPLYEGVSIQMKGRWAREATAEAYAKSMEARDILKTRYLQVLADHDLAGFVHTAIEHEPTLIVDGVNPPYVNHKGAPHLNTFLGDVPSIVVPAGYTTVGLPAGIAFLGRPYDDLAMIRYAHAFEAQTQARQAPQLETLRVAAA